MTALIAPPRSALEATYKAREVEGVLDLYFYRPIGFRLAQVFAKVQMKPAGVTLLAGLCGVIAGHLFYYRDLRTNAVGMALLVCANALDNADGQLARLTHQENRDGRIIDSIADHLVFVSIYLNLTLKQEMFSPHLKRLRDTVGQHFHSEIPNWLRTRYRNLAGPMFKWWGLLMTNTRMLVLFALLFIGQPMWYFWFELTLLN